MPHPQHAVLADPFAMLIHPEAVLSAIAQSGLLGALASRVCRPQDKPLIPKLPADAQRHFDEAIDSVEEPLSSDDLTTKV